MINKNKKRQPPRLLENKDTGYGRDSCILCLYYFTRIAWDYGKNHVKTMQKLCQNTSRDIDM